MSKELIQIIEEQTEILSQNVKVTLDLLDEECLEDMLSDMPVWKHVYHMLHSFDQWFRNPYQYDEPKLHEKEMNSLFSNATRKLSKDELITYYEEVRQRNKRYLSELNDEDLSEKPENCQFTRLALILAQYRHLMYHIGSLHCYMTFKTGKWPQFIGISPPINSYIKDKD